MYEGGLKIWECSLDLATFVATNVNVEKCNVIELGCGAALPAIVAALRGAARTDFQVIFFRKEQNQCFLQTRANNYIA